MTEIAVRPFVPGDRLAVERVVSAAFHPGNEAELVERIRVSEAYVAEMDLVADADGEVVGHVMVSHASITDAAGDTSPIAMLSPLAVAPSHQGTGVGGALVRAVCAIAEDRAEPVIVLEGSPAYYSRFGFEPAANLGITMPLPDWAPTEAAQVLRLRSFDLDAHPTGTVTYPPAFDGFE